MQTGEVDAPFGDFMNAFAYASFSAAPYTTNADGSILTVRIALSAGEHYVLRKKYLPDFSRFVSSNKNFKLVIR